MGRGLDGFLLDHQVRLLDGCAAFRARGPALAGRALPQRRARSVSQISVALAWGKHLFPFRTEKLSPTAPMVLVPYGTGRVGRRRFI